MENIKLLIVDDNSAQKKVIADYMSQHSRIEIVGCAENAAEALEFTKEYQPDIILTDIIMPETDGFYLLEKLLNDDIKKKPEVMVLSALGHEAIIRRAFDFGVKYYMVKPFDPELIYQRILDIFDLREIKSKPLPPAVTSKTLDEKITGIFLVVGIPAHIKGYQFLRSAIKIAIKNPDIINCITKELYPSVAKEFDTTASKVERAIRHAIDVAWNRGKIENLNKVFGVQIYNKNDKPTNGEFIALIADQLLIDRTA